MITTEFSYQVSRPDQIDERMWGNLQQVERDAFRFDLMDPELGERRLTQADVDGLVQWHDTDRYIATHRDPNLLVGNEHNADQEYHEPHVVMALDGSRPVGVLFTALNVSGSALARQAKWRMTSKQYLAHRSIAVVPEARGQGAATAMERIELELRDSRLNVSAYVWVDFMGKMYNRLIDRGFVETGRSPKPFIPRIGESPLARLQASSMALQRRGLHPESQAQRQVIRNGMNEVKNTLDI